MFLVENNETGEWTVGIEGAPLDTFLVFENREDAFLVALHWHRWVTGVVAFVVPVNLARMLENEV